MSVCTDASILLWNIEHLLTEGIFQLSLTSRTVLLKQQQKYKVQKGVIPADLET